MSQTTHEVATHEVMLTDVAAAKVAYLSRKAVMTCVCA